MSHKLKLGIASALLVPCAVMVAHAGHSGRARIGTVATAATSSQIATVTYGHDLRVTSALEAAPQLILTTPAADYTGDPVVATFSVQYANMIPQPNTTSNGIGFDLYMDGVLVERIGLFGNHNTSDNLFAPINLTDVLDGARTPPAGRHTFSIGVWKWQPGADGYLRGDGGMAMRLSVSRL